MISSEIIRVFIPQTMFGLGAINTIGDLTRGFAPSKILIVTDKGVVKAGIIDALKLPLNKAGFKADVFDKCGIEAPVSVIEELCRKIKDEKYDLLIGVGGGSSMDATKAASLLVANAGVTIQDLIKGRPVEKTVTKILVPTTAGTGSEWSLAAVVTNDNIDNRTYAFLSDKNYPDAVIIDPELTRNLPQKITADTGMDALTHAIEAYTSCRANIVSDMFASTAIRLVSGSLRQAYAKGSIYMDERYKISIAAALAMLAASHSGLGIAHIMNNALGKKAHISHGSTVTLLLPYVMEYNLIANPAKYAEVAKLLGENTKNDLSLMDAAFKSVEAVRRLASDLGLPQKLSDVGITEGDIPDLVDELMIHAPGIEFMNPREVSREDAIRIYTKAL